MVTGNYGVGWLTGVVNENCYAGSDRHTLSFWSGDRAKNKIKLNSENQKPGFSEMRSWQVVNHVISFWNVIGPAL